ncbi:MAG: ArsR family transcriptional regulator [Promethearchaeota archaeon]|nr:MAG: ArsR family transcriptional regulator [Candidatus Lokiarchaeota archaeon]
MEDEFYYALGHELRRKIIKIIGDNEYSSFTILKKELKVSTGTIYHHLDSLSQLIEQKEDKKYYLNDLGIYAYNSLQDNIETYVTREFSKKEFNSPILKALMFITPKSLITANSFNFVRILIACIVIIACGAILTRLNGLFPLFLYFGDFYETIEGLSSVFRNLLPIFFVLNYFIYFLIIEGLCRLFYKKKENSLKFFLSFSFIFLPMLIYLSIHYSFFVFGLITLPVVNIIENILLIVLQVWSLWIQTYNLSVYKYLKIETSLILSLLIHYGAFSLLLFISI